jgi:hypothetical protein
MRSGRFAPLSGLVFVVLLVIGFVVVSGNTPDINDSASKITSYYSDNKGREIGAAVTVMLATLFLAIFTASFRTYLRDSGDGEELWPNVAFLGGTVTVAGLLVAVGVHFALVDGADKNISPVAMQALNAIDSDNFFAFAFPLGLMLLGAAGAILRGGAALPKWMAWVAILLMIVFFTPAGFAAFALSGIWIIIASIMMFRRAGAPAATTTTA